jgi:hypothetical protein
MTHPVYNVRYSVVPINTSLLTVTLHSLVKTTLVNNDTKYSVPLMTLYQSSTALNTDSGYTWLVEYKFKDLNNWNSKTPTADTQNSRII